MIEKIVFLIFWKLIFAFWNDGKNNFYDRKKSFL
jgi:hypothetical protein